MELMASKMESDNTWKRVYFIVVGVRMNFHEDEEDERISKVLIVVISHTMMATVAIMMREVLMKTRKRN